MARIRTIKPEFFTSEDIVSLSAYARLLYIALWCEADKEGRLAWKPKTFKMRYFPADSLDIEALCAELTQARLVVLYGEGYAYIPSFTAHQHINPRESASQLPDPDACFTRAPRVTTRQPRDSDAQGGREGKGREGNEIDASASLPPKSSRKCRLPEGFTLSDAGMRLATDAGLDVQAEMQRFRDWHDAQGSTMADWQAAWRTWVGKAVEFGRGKKRVKTQAGDWFLVAGFDNAYEANNAGCYPHTVALFRDGKKLETT